jgi:YD repeat-containing protein
MFFYKGDGLTTVPKVYTDTSNVPTNRPADNAQGTNTLDNPDWNNPNVNDYMQWANSFHWGRQQFDNLSTQFLATGATKWDVDQLTSNDCAIARMRHWNQIDMVQGNNLSMEREPSPDGGTTPGKMTWYDYPGKPNYYTQGSSDTPILKIKVLPDGSEWYELYQLDQWNNRTNVITTYSVNGTVLTRTNRYVYAANGIDLLASIGPDGVTNAAYGYNTNHQVLFMTNALGEVTGYTYNANQQVTSITQPNGLVTTNIYGDNGYLAQQIFIGFSTNSYTYTNGLIYTHTDERGLTTTNTWDALGRLTQVVYPDGTSISYTYTNLDLVKVVDRMGSPPPTVTMPSARKSPKPMP